MDKDVAELVLYTAFKGSVGAYIYKYVQSYVLCLIPIKCNLT